MKYRTYATACAVAVALGLGAESVPTGTSTNADTRVTTELPPIVVEASRLGQMPNEMPAYVEVISQHDIAQSGATDIAELLRTKTTSLNFVPMISGNPAFTAVSPTGYGESGHGRFLVMIDGQRLNYPDMAAPLLSQIDLGSVSQIEILHGSQCVLRGDNASAGALNIVTDPPDYEHHGKIEAHAGTWDSYGARASYRGGDEAEGVKWWSSGGWDYSNGFRENSGYQIWNLSGGLKKEWENGTYLRTSTFWNDSEYDLPGSTEWPSPDDWARRHTVGLTTTFNGVVNDENRVKVDLLTSMNHARSVWKSSGSWLENDIYSHEITPQWICTTPISRLDNDFVLGTTYRLEELHGNALSYYYPPKYQYERQSMAFFAQDTLHVTDKFAVEVGGRWQRTWSEVNSYGDSNSKDNNFAVDAALLFTPTKNLKTYARLSRFFRYPFLDEAFLGADGRTTGNLPDPEYGTRFNIGAEWMFLKDFTAFIDAGVSRTTDEIFYDPLIYYNPIFNYWAGSNINAPGDVRRETLTLGLKWEREKVAALSFGYTFSHATFDGGKYDEKDVPFSPTSTVQTNGRLWLWNEFSVLGGYRFLSTRYQISDFDNAFDRMPSLSLFHIGCRYEPTDARLKGFYVALMVNNLLDRDYDEYCAYGTASYPGPGRSVTCTLGWEF